MAVKFRVILSFLFADCNPNQETHTILSSDLWHMYSAKISTSGHEGMESTLHLLHFIIEGVMMFLSRIIPLSIESHS